jgi:hypothetical protein
MPTRAPPHAPSSTKPLLLSGPLSPSSTPVCLYTSGLMRRSWRTSPRPGPCGGSVTVNGRTEALPTDPPNPSLRVAVTNAHLAAGATPDELAATDPGRAAITSILTAQSVFANQPGHFGYGCLNGTPVPATYLEQHVLDPGERLILTSDGYPDILDTYAATEEHLADLLAADPLCIRELASTKALALGAASYDDRTWLDLTT